VNYKAADLDQRVTFKREVTTSDGMGGQTHSFTEIATVWALVRPMSGREREQAQRLNAQSNYLMVIRNRDDIDETHVAEWDGVTFNIRFAKAKARSRWLEIEVERGVAS
jgi:SPP1 family predicted phage head-tail adaptor